jgi:hypothetical protein
VDLTNNKWDDKQRAIIESPVFILKEAKMTFLISGGKFNNTFLGLYTLDGKQRAQVSAKNDARFIQASFTKPQLVGKKVFIRIVDNSNGPWGHICFDHFQVKGTIDLMETKKRFAQ